MTKKQHPINMSSPDINQDDIQAVYETMQTPYLSIGPKIKDFEQAFREFVGAPYAIGVNSGTSGLHLCIRASGVEAMDYVITTPFSFVSSTNVILFEKAIPVFVDVDPKTGNIDPEQAARAVDDLSSGEAARMRKWLPKKGAPTGGKLRSILSVDVFGQPADYDPLRKIADSHHLTLIEDSCEALGAEYKNRKAGMLGDFGVFAFYPNKQITTGEGGMIITADPQAADLMMALRNQGRAPNDTWLQHTYLGYNYRLDELSAALGVSQMKRIRKLLRNRTRVANWYNQRLGQIHEIQAPFITDTTTTVSWFVYVIRVDATVSRDQLAKDLQQAGIPVRPYFLPIHLQPYMKKEFGYQAGDFPVTEDLGSRCLALPFSGRMTEDQVETVCSVLKTCLNK